MITIDHDTYTAHLKNLRLFLTGRRLDAQTYRFYIFLLKAGAKQGNYAIKSTVNILSAKSGHHVQAVTEMLFDLNHKGLFEQMQINTDRIFIKIKKLESYARLTQ